MPPEFFVFPVDVVRAARRDKGWRKVFFSAIPDVETYLERWDLIEDFLANRTVDTTAAPTGKRVRATAMKK